MIIQIVKVISKYKRDKNNYNNSSKTELEVFSNVRCQYIYERAKPRGICIIK